MSEYGSLVEPLLQEIDLDVEGLHVVAIGGGSGLASALKAIQHYTDVITAVVTVADNGGSSGRLSPDLGIPPPGDLRQALLALSEESSVWRELIAYRFSAGDVSGHSLGNLILAALADIGGNFEDALDTAGRLLGAAGAVVPASDGLLQLEAIVDGDLVVGQTDVGAARGELTELRLAPDGVRASRRALDAIRSADQIVLGPGSLFTSICAGLLVPGIAEAVSASPAQLVYVCNLVTEDGETLGMDGRAHVAGLMEFGGIRTPDIIVAHRGPMSGPGMAERVAVDPGAVRELGCTVEMADLAIDGADIPTHDPARLGAVLRRLA